jgi:hypothetical protein
MSNLHHISKSPNLYVLQSKKLIRKKNSSQVFDNRQHFHDPHRRRGQIFIQNSNFFCFMCVSKTCLISISTIFPQINFFRRGKNSLTEQNLNFSFRVDCMRKIFF